MTLREIKRPSKIKNATLTMSQIVKAYPTGGSVDLASLKKKGLVEQDVNELSVKGKASIKDIKFVVTANEFELDSIKAIKAGKGRVIQLVYSVPKLVCRGANSDSNNKNN